MSHTIFFFRTFPGLPALAFSILALVHPAACAEKAVVPDLTVTGEIAKVDTKQTYNLGPTGMRGWIYHAWSVVPGHDDTTGFAPYQ
ncbi:MAG: hypothetical protein WCN98_06355, partial [Verrucomicrobiaceae bacterium]